MPDFASLRSLWPTAKKEEDAAYLELPQSEKRSEDGSPAGGKTLATRSAAKWTSRTTVLAITNVLTLLLLALVGAKLYRTSKPDYCVRKLVTPSPALDAVKLLPPAKYKGDFRTANRWRGPPGTQSDEIDAAWWDITLGPGGIWVTEEEKQALNVTGDETHPVHKIPSEFGEGYVAILEVFHMLHCLDSLRQGLFFNYPRYKHKDKDVPMESIYTHFDHCIDLLRINLMCNADVTPALFVDPLLNPKRRDGLPDWSTMHTCRDFDAIRDWTMHGPRHIRWRDSGSNPAWDPNLPGSDAPFPPEHKDGTEEEEHDHHH